MVFEMTLKHGGGFRGFGVPKIFKIFRNLDFGVHICAAGAPDFAPLRAFLRRRRFFYKSCTYTEGFLHLESAAGENFCKSCACTKGFLYLESAAGENFCKICAYTEGFLHLESAAGDFFYKICAYTEGFSNKKRRRRKFLQTMHLYRGILASRNATKTPLVKPRKPQEPSKLPKDPQNSQNSRISNLKSRRSLKHGGVFDKEGASARDRGDNI